MPVEVLRLKVSKECFERIDSGTIKEILFDPYDKENVPKLLDVAKFNRLFLSNTLFLAQFRQFCKIFQFV